MKTRRPKKPRSPITPAHAHAFADRLFGEDMHAKRVRSISDATVGVLEAGELGIHAIGRGIAAAKGLADKHAIKQVDCCIGNEAIDVDALMARWVPHCTGESDEIRVNMDWTEFDADNHSMLMISLQTDHGRATPLLWRTVVKSRLKGRRNEYEDEMPGRLRELVPSDVRVTVVADRAFGDEALLSMLSRDLGFEYVIRIRGNILVRNERGTERRADRWPGTNGRMTRLVNASVTTKGTRVGQFVALRDRAMQDTWCLVASNPTWSGSTVKKWYGKRFTCEETFRDVKDLRYGLGMKWKRVTSTERRDRMMLIAAMAILLLSLLGAAGESAGLDRLLKANTAKKRTLSLFRQGLRWFQLIPNMPDERPATLLAEYDKLVRQHSLFVPLLNTGSK